MGRPNITLKIASSLDGKIALSNGQSEWITGEAAREHGRRLRGAHDAIAIGANTALLDNPQLTTRIDGLPDPIRLIFDTKAKLSLTSNLVKTAKDIPTYIITGRDSDAARHLAEQGVIILFSGVTEAGYVDIKTGLDLLTHHGIRTLLLEGGGTLAASFFKQDFIDVIEWYRAPIILGADGRSAIGELGLENMNALHRFNRISLTEIGADIHERYERIR